MGVVPVGIAVGLVAPAGQRPAASGGAGRLVAPRSAARMPVPAPRAAVRPTAARVRAQKRRTRRLAAADAAPELSPARTALPRRQRATAPAPAGARTGRRLRPRLGTAVR